MFKVVWGWAWYAVVWRRMVWVWCHWGGVGCDGVEWCGLV